jgi:hypothetical protein
MYKHGKPIYKFDFRPLAVIIAVLLLVLVAIYFKFIAPASKTDITTNNKPLISTVKVGPQNTEITEKDFTMSLPGKWVLAQQNWDARYRAWQWQLKDAKIAAGRWVRVYEDTIPGDYAYNYLLPVSANGFSLTIGSISGACSDFTTTAQTHENSSGTIAAVSKWQGVSFYCDYGRQTLQTVGTSSTEAINTVTLQNASGVKHKFFFLYQDNNINPDLGLLSTILATFQVK